MFRVLCIALLFLLFPSTNLSAQTEGTKLKILTLNTWNIPILRKRSNRRSKMIGHYSSGYDIVGFQEVFGRKPRKQILEFLNKGNKFYHKFQTPPPRRINSGLLNVSKLKVTANNFKQFEICKRFQCIAGKGILHTRIMLSNGIELDVFNTHMEPYEERSLLRVGQLKTVLNFIKKHNNESRPLILLGDFNIIGGSEEYQFLAKELLSKNIKDAWSELKGNEPGYTYNGMINNWIISRSPTAAAERIDYIFYREGLDTDLSIKEIKVVFDKKLPELNKSKPKSYFLSDHFGVSLEFELKKTSKFK